MQLAIVFATARRTSFGLGALSLPLSLSLPHKGGGNRAARTFATHTLCLRVNVVRMSHHAT